MSKKRVGERVAARTVAEGSAKTAVNSIRNVCVYCGSGLGKNPVYTAAARTLGAELAANRIGLVYGGGGLGLMGEVARSTLDHGGRGTGILPGLLPPEEAKI